MRNFKGLLVAIAILGGSVLVGLNTVACTFELKDKITKIIKVVDFIGENVPVATNDDVPVGGQIANVVILKNKDATVNDFNIADSSVVVVSKPMDADDPNNDTGEYVYGVFTAVLVGAGHYIGTLNITGSFGRLNP